MFSIGFRSSMVIQFDSVYVALDSKDILSNISFSVLEGGKVALVGKSGAGKSSILYVLLGLLIPTAGEVKFNGTKVDFRSIDSLRSSVSYIGQEPVLGDAETVRDALMLPFCFKENKHLRPDEAAMKETLSLLDLPADIMDSSVSDISGGEKQRVALCRGLLQKKRIFLLDEVTSALDKESSRAVMKLLSQKQYTFLSVSHHDEWIAGCDTVIELSNGEISSIKTGAENGNN